MNTVKRNVEEFNENVLNRGGYLYTTHAQLSSFLSNKRISEEVNKLIGSTPVSIMDAGCGDGTYTQEFFKRYPFADISGFDPASEAIAMAQANYPGINFFTANILDERELKAYSSDVSVIRGVLHHVSEPVLAIRNVAMISKKLIIVEPNGNNPILKIIEKLSPYHRKHEEQSFSSIKLKEWCEQNGLKVISLNYIGFIPFFFPAILSKIIYFFQPFLEKIYLLKKYFGAQIVIMAVR